MRYFLLPFFSKDFVDVEREAHQIVSMMIEGRSEEPLEET